MGKGEADMIEDCRLGLYEKAMPDALTWAEKLAGAKEAGFDYVEISVDESAARLARLDMSAAARLALFSDMVKEGIRIESMCLSGHRRFPLGSLDEDVRKTSIEVMRKAIVLAADLGVRIIQIAGYDEYYHPSSVQTQEYFGENLRLCVDIASQYGVILAFETMEPPFMNTVWKAMYWVKKINSPYLQVYPDSGNITNGACTDNRLVSEDVASGAGHIVAVHLKESAPGKYREVPYGTGQVNFSDIISAARRLGVRRFTGEFWYKEGNDWRRDLGANAAFLRAQFR